MSRASAADPRKARRVGPAWLVTMVLLGACGERVVSTDAPSEIPGSAVTTFATVAIDTAVDTVPQLPTTIAPAPLVTVGPYDSLPPPIPATEHQLEVLAGAFAMPGRPDLHDVPYGQAVTTGNRDLHVNVPIFGIWQYHDLDAQSRAGATPEASEAATRELLAKLGIDTTGLPASFVDNGPMVEVHLADCIVTFADDGRLASALGPLEAIT